MTPDQFEQLMAVLKELAQGMRGDLRRDLTLVLIGAVVGGLASAFGAIFVYWLEHRRRVRVTCKIALATAPTAPNGVGEFVSIRAVNTGRPITITSAGLRMSNGSYLTQMRSNMGPIPLPKKISDGDPVEVYFDLPEVKKALREHPNVVYTSAFVADAEGHEYRADLPRMLKELSPRD